MSLRRFISASDAFVALALSKASCSAFNSSMRIWRRSSSLSRCWAMVTRGKSAGLIDVKAFAAGRWETRIGATLNLGAAAVREALPCRGTLLKMTLPVMGSTYRKISADTPPDTKYKNGKIKKYFTINCSKKNKSSGPRRCFRSGVLVLDAHSGKQETARQP